MSRSPVRSAPGVHPARRCELADLAWVAGLLLTAAAAPAPALAADLSGELSGNLPAGVYRVVEDAWVPEGATLTLAPGVVFEFADSFWEQYELDVRGTLLAEGSAAQPIIFRAAPGVEEWNYLRLAGPGSRLRHCSVERAGRILGADEGGLWIDGSSPWIESCVVRSGTWHGIFVSGSAARPQVRWVECRDNAGAGLAAAEGAGLDVSHSTVTGNAGGGIVLADGPNLLVNCLVADNAGDGIASEDGACAAALAHCTIAGSGGVDLADCDLYALYNCVAGRAEGPLAACVHSYVIDDPGFLRFADPASGDYRLAEGSPCLEAGTRFGEIAAWLPETDLDGRPRIHGIPDLGAYESPAPPDPGTAGAWFSPALIEPRRTHPQVRTPGEALCLRIAALGSFGPSDAAATLIGPDGRTIALVPEEVAAREATPESDLALLLHLPGIDTVQEVTTPVPSGTPEGLYDLRVTLGGLEYFSRGAVQVRTAYPGAWSLLHVTDTHIGATGEAYTAAERMRRLVREANFLDPDLVVVTGDVCENQNLENAAWVDSFLAIAAELRVPLFVLPGNHDLYNEGGEHNPYGYFRYFQGVNRYRTAEVAFGPARLYAMDTGPEQGTLELYRCLGPETPALDWIEARLEQLDPQAHRPRFFLMHGPNYDYFSYNLQNTDRVRDLMQEFGVSLCFAGHTHRFETYRNEGENFFGRNDYSHEDDWGRDVPFPGYPLHVQTSSLGKDGPLPLPVAPSPTGADPHRAVRLPHRRGVFGDDVGFRIVRVRDLEVEYFTSDTDGDGWRSTEDAWLLGELVFSMEERPGGVLVSTVENRHHEGWADVRHFLPGDPDRVYQIEGGSWVRTWADGTVEVRVDSVAALASTTVTLTPAGSGVRPPRASAALSMRPAGNPFAGETTLTIQAGKASSADAAEATLLLFDAAGRQVRDLSSDLRRLCAGRRALDGPLLLRWDGRDDGGAPLPSGAYFARLSLGGRSAVARLVRLRSR